MRGSERSPLHGTQQTASGIQCPALYNVSCTALEEEMCQSAVVCSAETTEVEHFCEERLGKQDFFSLEKNWLWEDLTPVSLYLQGGCLKAEAWLFAKLKR